MKKLLLLLAIIIGGSLFAQGIYDPQNSTITTLDSGGVYTGNFKDCSGYSSINLMVYSDSSSATNGVQVWFSFNKDSSDFVRYWSYTRLDTTESFTCPVLAPYYKVIYKNGIDSQGVFSLKSYLSKEYTPKTNEKGESLISSSQLDSILAQNALILLQGTARNQFLDSIKAANDSIISLMRSTLHKVNSTNNNFGGIVNLTDMIGLRNYHTDVNKQHIGYGGLYADRIGNYYLIYRVGTSHSAGGALWITKSIDLLTWSTPACIFNDPGYDNIGTALYFDDATNRCFVTFSQRANADAENVTLQVWYNDGNLFDSTAWHQSTVNTPFAKRTQGDNPIVKVAYNKLWLPCYGDGTAANPLLRSAILQSTDNGLTWDSLKVFTEFQGSECAIYKKYMWYTGKTQFYLLSRVEDSSNSYIAYSSDFWVNTSNMVKQCAVAGNPIVIEINGYYVLFARQNNPTGGNVGIVQYSLDGLNWSRPEYFGGWYPLQTHITQTASGKIILSGCTEKQGTDTYGSVWMCEYYPPNYLEVIEKVRRVDINTIKRYTTVSSGTPIYSDFQEALGGKINFRLRTQSGNADSLTIKVGYLDPLLSSDQVFVDVTSTLTRVSGVWYGEINLLSSYYRIRIDNAGTSRNVYAIINYED